MGDPATSQTVLPAHPQRLEPGLPIIGIGQTDRCSFLVKSAPVCACSRPVVCIAAANVRLTASRPMLTRGKQHIVELATSLLEAFVPESHSTSQFLLRHARGSTPPATISL